MTAGSLVCIKHEKLMHTPLGEWGLVLSIESRSIKGCQSKYASVAFPAGVYSIPTNVLKVVEYAVAFG